MLMDTSSEMILGLLPVFLVSVLGASALQLGFIEGIAEATASLTRVVSGALSDRVRKRKLPTAVGYALAAATKPLFALAPSIGWIFTARFVDRLGKGIRGAPRDALIADIAPADRRGASYGLRQSLDSVGAVLGPILAMVFMVQSGGSFRLVFWIAWIPALLSVLVLLAGVSEPEVHRVGDATRPSIRPRELGLLGPGYWAVVGVGCIFTLARFSEAFLLLRSAELGVPPAWTPLVLAGMNVAYAASSYPAGRLSDRVPRRHLLTLGMGLLLASHLVMTAASGIGLVALGVGLWGLHMGASQGVLAAAVSDAAPPTLRGTAFGIFHLATGLSALAASVLAGGLWQSIGPQSAFAVGAGFAALALILWTLRHARPR
jgi:MFS family permease